MDMCRHSSPLFASAAIAMKICEGAGRLLELARIHPDLDRLRPVLRLGEPSQTLVVHRKYLRKRALVGIGPGAPDHGAGEGQFSRVIDGETEIGEARGLRVEIER